jgi:hypothetical protein
MQGHAAAPGEGLYLRRIGPAEAQVHHHRNKAVFFFAEQFVQDERAEHDHGILSA